MSIHKLDIMNEFETVKKQYTDNIEQMYVDFVKMRFFINSQNLQGDFQEFINEVKLGNILKKNQEDFEWNSPTESKWFVLVLKFVSTKSMLQFKKATTVLNNFDKQ